MITITTDLDIVSSGVMPVIHMSQYDSDFTLVFNIFASRGTFSMPSGTTAEIRGTKTDGNGYDAAGTVSGTTVTITGDEQMTAVAGRNIYEIALYKDSKRLNTINFILDVERAALDADTITSESILRELNAIIEGAATAEEAAAAAIAAAATFETDPTLTVAGKAADAKAAGEAIAELAFSDDIRDALLNCFQHVAWTDDQGQIYYNELEAALYPNSYPQIRATYTPGTHAVYIDDELSSLTDYLTVKYYETEESTGETISSSDYILSGALQVGESTIAVTYGDYSTSFTIANVADYYNIYTWDFANNAEALRMEREEKAAVSYDRGSSETYRYIPALSPNVLDNRTWFGTSKGKAGTYIVGQDTGTRLSPDRYLIPVPEDATSATFLISPSEQYCYMQLWKYEGNGQWTRGINTGLKQGTATLNFTAGENQYVSFNCTATSGGNVPYSDPTYPRPTLTVTFATS